MITASDPGQHYDLFGGGTTLTVNNAGVVLLNKNKCIGCLACVSVCPINAMMWFEGGKSPFKCIACGKCADACPEQALEIVEEG